MEAAIILLIIAAGIGLIALSGAAAPTVACTKHTWVYDHMQALYCKVCNKRPGTDTGTNGGSEYDI